VTQELSGRTILVTGSSKGIGAATAYALGGAGAHVVAHYGSDEAGARDAVALVPEERRLLVQADLQDPGGAQRLWEAASGWRGRVDVLVNNAAVMEDTPLDAPDDEWRRGWERSLQVNVLAPAMLTRAAVRHFLERGGGVVITLSSWVAQRGPADESLVAYAASKAAVKALTQTIARHHAKDGVLAYVIAPGVVRTRLSERAAARTGGEEAVTATLAMGEWVPPQELAELVVFLAGGRVRHLTGATLDVNGATYVR
jgi:NAD(P)-dependent dehydrogenase (short-subunit alcohol dehydrogenase family)